MNLPLPQLFAALIIGHAIADYPLQGDFLAKAKNHKDPIPGIDWWIALTMHCLMHGGMVWAITGEFWLGVSEFAVHWYIDWLKCEGATSFKQDQAAHVACKVFWVLCALAYSL